MNTKGTEVIHHGLLIKRQMITRIILCLEFPVFSHHVIIRRLQRMVGINNGIFLLKYATSMSILMEYRKRFLNPPTGGMPGE